MAKAEIKFDPKNARKHGERNKALIKKSLEEVGGFRSIAIDGNNILRAGNGVYEQARALGLKTRIVDAKPGEIIAVRRNDLKGKRAERAALLDNRAGELSEWDADVIKDLDKDLLEGIFDAGELKQLGMEEEAEEDPGDLIDKAAELQKKWKVRAGDLWQLGKHKLLCGDSLDAEAIANLTKTKVMGVCTDPPYDLDGHEVIKAIENFSDIAIVLCADALAFDLTKFWQMSLDFIWRHRKPRSFPTKYQPVFYHNHCLIIKRNEKIKTGWRRPRNDYGSVIDIENEFEDTEMGHGKNAELFVQMMEGFNCWQTVGEPFAGTGATIIACEHSKRQCFAVEREPKICAVALERWTRSFPALKPQRA